MEEKLSDKICNEVFIEYYINKNYIESLKQSKKVYRLLIKNDKQDYKDYYYIWMILLIIIKSHEKLNKIDKSLKYIMLSLRYADMEYKTRESLYYLIQYYIKMNDYRKLEHYINKYVENKNKKVNYKNCVDIIHRKD